MRKKKVFFISSLCVLCAFAVQNLFAGEETPAEKVQQEKPPVVIKYTDSEKKALRNEMIEMDINIRSLVSMISLNRPDRIEPIFQKFTSFQMENSPYFKNGIAGVSRKWKANSLYGYAGEIQSEADKMLKYFAKERDSGMKNPDWELVFQATKKMLENCQQCHTRSGVNRP